MSSPLPCSPLRILQMTPYPQMGPGHLGVLIARAGVGKTACLVHMAVGWILQERTLVHVSLDEPPERVAASYELAFRELRQRGQGVPEGKEDLRALMERRRMILAFLQGSFDLERLRVNLESLRNGAGFRPQLLILDGLDLSQAGRPLLEGLRELVREFSLEGWLTGLAHRHIQEVNPRGIPFPCHEVDDLFTVILQLVPEAEGLSLRLLKNREVHTHQDLRLKLDPRTCLPVG